MTEEDNDRFELIINGYKEFGHDSDLTQWERDFMDSQVERFEQYGSRTRVSDKQWDVLDRIYGKLPI